MILTDKFKINPYLAVFLAASIGGLGGVIIKTVNLPATSMAFIRLLIPTALIGGYLIARRVNCFRGDFKPLLLAGFLNAVRLLLYYLAFLYTSLANAVIILFTWPIFSASFGKLALKEKTTSKEWFLVIISFLGIIIMYIGNVNLVNVDFLGMTMMLVSAIMYAMTVVIYKAKIKDYSDMEIVFYQNFLGSIIFLPFFLFNRPWPQLAQVSIAVVFFGLLVGVISFLLFFIGLRRLSVIRYSILTYWEVPTTIIFGILLMNENLTIGMIVGGLLIIGANIGLLIKNKTSEVC